VSYRPQIACITSVVGRRFGPPKNFGVAPPMVSSPWTVPLSHISRPHCEVRLGLGLGGNVRGGNGRRSPLLCCQRAVSVRSFRPVLRPTDHSLSVVPFTRFVPCRVCSSTHLIVVVVLMNATCHPWDIENHAATNNHGASRPPNNVGAITPTTNCLIAAAH